MIMIKYNDNLIYNDNIDNEQIHLKAEIFNNNNFKVGITGRILFTLALSYITPNQV